MAFELLLGSFMVIKRHIPDVTPKLAQASIRDFDPTSTRFDVLQEIVERVLRNKPEETRATLKTDAA